MAARRIAIVGGGLLATFALWLLVNNAGLGISFLFVAPTLLAAWWFGSRGGLAAGLAAGLLFGLAGTIVGEAHVLASALTRGAIYCLLGYLVGMLLEQRLALRGELAAQGRELTELRAIQEALVPTELPRRPALELASCYVPAEQGVAGDFFLVAAGPADATIVVIGDVLGKGLEAARRASFVRAALATFAPFTDDPVRLLDMANYSLIEKAGTSQTFVTAACVTYRPRESALAWALAGHPPPVLLGDGRPLEGARPGVPLGIEVDLGCGAGHQPLAPGAGVLLYTDGLSEARPPDGRGGLLGLERVCRVVAEAGEAPPALVVERLRGVAEELSGGRLADDLCMVALRVSAATRAAHRPGAAPSRAGGT